MKIHILDNEYYRLERVLAHIMFKLTTCNTLTVHNSALIPVMLEYFAGRRQHYRTTHTLVNVFIGPRKWYLQQANRLTNSPIDKRSQSLGK